MIYQVPMFSLSETGDFQSPPPDWPRLGQEAAPKAVQKSSFWKLRGEAGRGRRIGQQVSWFSIGCLEFPFSGRVYG